MLKKLANHLLDFIWPQFCLGCGREGNLCCPYCLNDIILEYDCKVSWPDSSQLAFDSCYICCNYQAELVQKIIKNYKYSYLENMSTLLINILERQARRLGLSRDTLITNVPLHSRKLRQRGFDQTELLARGLAKKLDLPYTKMLKRQRYTKAQAQLSKTDRQKNLRQAFTVVQSWQKGRNILLIDDVATTGSTLNQAALALKKLGTEKIICLVIAKN